MKYLITIYLILCTMYSNAQSEFDKMLTGMYEYTVPLVKSEQLKEWMNKEEIVVLDAREAKEFKTSHIRNAKEVGYDKFDISAVDDVTKDAKVVVYCSVGYRSERIGEKLMQQGYKNVYNLYGGIFDWVNKGNAVYSSEGKVAKVHAYNQDWGKWVQNKEVKKIY